MILGVYTEDELVDHEEFIPASRTVNSTDLEGYQAFEDEHLPTLKSEAQYGTERLQAAYVAIPKATLKAFMGNSFN